MNFYFYYPAAARERLQGLQRDRGGPKTRAATSVRLRSANSIGAVLRAHAQVAVLPISGRLVAVKREVANWQERAVLAAAALN